MSNLDQIGIVGGGLIGLSWAALASSLGHKVVIIDPDPECSQNLSAFLAHAWPNLAELGLAHQPTAPDVSPDYAALKGARFVQDNAPERIAVKHEVIRQIEAQVGPEVVIASSTSSLMASDLQQGAKHPERILVAHPMNPPHLIPMVELVAGRLTAPEAMDQAEAHYHALHRVPIRAKREVQGHIANRLTAALYREAVNLVAEGIADVADIDRAIANGPGLRWALMGPHLTYHLGGGAGGYRAYLDHLGPTQEARWKDLGHPELTEALKAELVAGVEAELASMGSTDLRARRDAALVALLRLKGDQAL